METMQNNNPNADVLTSASHDHNPMLAAADIPDDSQFDKSVLLAQIQAVIAFPKSKDDEKIDSLMRLFDKMYFEQNSVAKILKEWILRHERFTREKPYIRLPNNQTMSLNDILFEIENYTEFGKEQVKNIIGTAITLVQRDIDKL